MRQVRSWSFGVPVFLCVSVALVSVLGSNALVSSVAAQGLQNVDRRTQQAIETGEFAVAKSTVLKTVSGTSARDSLLGQVAARQASIGETSAASQTLRGVASADVRQSVVDQAGHARGGSSMADFTTLMQLIETTVVPDTWEALGGNSTMAPYPQGVFVDPNGTLVESPVESTDAFAGTWGDLKTLLASSDTGVQRDWRLPSGMRCVSLRRLRDTVLQRRLLGQDLGDAIVNMAGLSNVQYVVLTEDDVLLAASVGGIEQNEGWFVDRRTGRTPLRYDFLARSFAAAIGNEPFGCTIDPTPTGMENAMRVASEIQTGKRPIGKAADDLATALGMQRVEVFGSAADNAVALLMVEADRHMKQLALGEFPMPDGAKNYLDAVDALIDQGPPSDLLLRLWFTNEAMRVRCDPDQHVFELSGTPIKLSRENQRALANGNRGDVIADPRSTMFVDDFNRNWTRIRDAYPIYGALESLYHAAAAAQLVCRYGTQHQELFAGIASDEDAVEWLLHTPRQVASIATKHTVRKGSQRHHIILASGASISLQPIRFHPM
ncbi:DUF1598 domain-containing protein [Rhodopirellula sp. MGV]|uniref:DUF1598 domain-containing protein n=1 Tax=Rhodopirellula sp. MGV TaxID=2023130 RepID=UPI000B96ACDE|nr:DUF1598 domain-containing protein [Rhodopirellula sp. MGV]OYP39088.1 hypothetical protein CGZ80_00090 [Rhodopirellula sp. MGV]